MPQHIQRHLKDTATEQFLQNRGFRLTESTSKSVWECPVLRLHLDELTIIDNDYTLFTFIYKTAFGDGMTEGKREAVDAIYHSIYKAVYRPELKDVDNEPTIA